MVSFDVQMPTSTVDNTPVFNGVTDYTQRGDFQVNANGNLVNGAGYYLMGVSVDPTTGNPVGNVPQVLQFQNNFVPAQATSSIQYAVNLPTTPSTIGGLHGSGRQHRGGGRAYPGDFTAGYNPLVTGTPTFTNASVTGTAVNDQDCGRGPDHRPRHCPERREPIPCRRALRPATPSRWMARF